MVGIVSCRLRWIYGLSHMAFSFVMSMLEIQGGFGHCRGEQCQGWQNLNCSPLSNRAVIGIR